ncbi:hypothetical protein LY78DRAFT_481931 [Colletotrichum sublineola]|nr:hypothetical protein LY78DRAFT_481931 [Colletotrichum sublineola]
MAVRINRALSPPPSIVSQGCCLPGTNFIRAGAWVGIGTNRSQRTGHFDPPPPGPVSFSLVETARMSFRSRPA